MCFFGTDLETRACVSLSGPAVVGGSRTQEDIFSVDFGVLLCKLKDWGKSILLVQKVVQSLLGSLKLVGSPGGVALRHLHRLNNDLEAESLCTRQATDYGRTVTLQYLPDTPRILLRMLTWISRDQRVFALTSLMVVNNYPNMHLFFFKTWSCHRSPLLCGQ